MLLNQVLLKMAIIFIVACSACNAEQQNMYTSPDAVSVRPVFFVPEGQSAPTDLMRNLAGRHIKWSQETYSKLLAGRDTFRISPEPPVICKGKYDLSCYKKLPENGAPNFLSEILDYLNMNRFNCPYVFVIIVMNEKDHFPNGGGRPLNGGLNTGGGIVLWNSFNLISCPNNQSTLRHELGHAFGLPHVDVYGYPMNSNASIMSYNRNHHTTGFRESKTPGKFIPEDIRALSLNKRVFPNLCFDSIQDVPKDYRLAPNIIHLGPMKIPNQAPYMVLASTWSGEAFGSKASNAVLGQINTSEGPGNTYNSDNMWHSEHVGKEMASLEMVFPVAVEIDKIIIHSQHSGLSHEAKAVEVNIIAHDSVLKVAKQRLVGIDAPVVFKPTKALRWRLDFKPSDSGYVVIRGLEFFLDNKAVFPPLVNLAGAKRIQPRTEKEQSGEPAHPLD